MSMHYWMADRTGGDVLALRGRGGGDAGSGRVRPAKLARLIAFEAARVEGFGISVAIHGDTAGRYLAPRLITRLLCVIYV